MITHAITLNDDALGSATELAGVAIVQAFEELSCAVEKFPTWPNDPIHAAAIVAEELGELQQAILECVYDPEIENRSSVHKEAVQTAAMALRFLMSIERYTFAPATQHTQE